MHAPLDALGAVINGTSKKMLARQTEPISGGGVTPCEQSRDGGFSTTLTMRPA